MPETALAEVKAELTDEEKLAIAISVARNKPDIFIREIHKSDVKMLYKGLERQYCTSDMCNEGGEVFAVSTFSVIQ